MIDKIGVATNFTADDATLIEALRKFRDVMGCHLHIIHIETEQEEDAAGKMKTFCDPWLNDKNITKHCIAHKDINEGLDEFVKEKNIDLLALLSHKRNWFEEL